ncbi:MAG: hypothetical protein JWN17_1271 [Frankiales bacterium]|nr:hypothetical protein [Frankiales bacterium]
MRTTVRRRLAAGGGLLSAALVAGSLVVAAGPASAAASTNDVPVNSAASRVTFSTTARVVTGSSVVFTGPSTSVAVVDGARSATFTSSVDMNNGAMTAPSTQPDFTDPDPVSATAPGPGPVDPGRYSVEFDAPVLAPGVGGGRVDGCVDCLSITTPTAPTVTGSTGLQVEAGGSRELALPGTGFARSTRVEVLKADGTSDVAVSASGVPGKTTPTRLTRTFTPAPAATPGVRSIRFTNTDGQTTTCAGCFTVLAPSLSAVSPRAAANSGPIDLTFTGPAGTFTGASRPVLQYASDVVGSANRAALSVSGTNVRPSADGSTLVATFDLTGAAPRTDGYLPAVTTGSATNVSNDRFSVTQPAAPTVTGVTPATGEAGRTLTLQVAGTGFARGAAVAFEQTTGTVTTTTTSVPASAVDYRSTSLLVVTVTFPAGSTGAYAVRVTNTDGKTVVRPASFTVTAASPSPSVSPTSSATRSPSAGPTTTPGASATPTVSSSPTRSATASPTPALQQPTIDVSPSTIVAVQQKATVFGTAPPGSLLEIRAYSRPSTTFTTVRSVTVGPDGQYSFVVGPSGNTRLFARSTQGGLTSDSRQVVLTVRTSLNLKVARTGTRTYRFTGSLLPKRPGQLITVFYERSDGSRVIAARARNAADGTYNVSRTFTGGGTFTLFTGTGTDNNNAANNSNRVRVAIR